MESEDGFGKHLNSVVFRNENDLIPIVELITGKEYIKISSIRKSCIRQSLRKKRRW